MVGTSERERESYAGFGRGAGWGLRSVRMKRRAAGFGRGCATGNWPGAAWATAAA